MSVIKLSFLSYHILKEQTMNAFFSFFIDLFSYNDEVNDSKPMKMFGIKHFLTLHNIRHYNPICNYLRLDFVGTKCCEFFLRECGLNLEGDWGFSYL